jgi:hypothetical protein
MPLGGALLLTSAAFEGRAAALARVGAVVLAAVPALVWTTVVTDLRPARFGSGSWCAVGGTLFAIGSLTAALTPRRSRVLR